MFHLAPHVTLNTRRSSPPPTSLVCFCRLLLQTRTCCTLILREDPRRDGTSAEYASSTGYVPKRIGLKGYSRQSTKSKLTIRMIWETGQTVVPQPIIQCTISGRRRTNTSDAGITTCTFGNERNNGKTRAYHSERESFVTGFSRDLEVSGKLVAVFSCHSESTQNT